MNIRVEKYGNRNWVVMLNDSILAVTVYKKGAMAVMSTMRGLHAKLQMPSELSEVSVCPNHPDLFEEAS